MGYSRTISTGNYNSEKIHAGFAGGIKNDVDINQAFDEAYKLVEGAINAEVKALGLE